jgi:ElaB/YqjD/DUF883 family membrane-anchored ribosome-binding protein
MQTDNDPEVIRRQMEETRTSLQDKLETLEQQVKETVQGATVAATETVQTVKDAVEETVETVKETVDQTVQSVKKTFDVRHQVHEHPWTMLLGAAAVGFVGGRLIYGSEQAPALPLGFEGPGQVEPTPSKPHRNGKSHPPPPTDHAGFWSGVAGSYRDELAKVQGLAVGVAASVVREWLTSSAPPALAEQIAEIVDSFTAKLGGKPIHGSVFQTTPATPPANHPRFDRSNNVEPLAP